MPLLALAGFIFSFANKIPKSFSELCVDVTHNKYHVNINDGSGFNFRFIIKDYVTGCSSYVGVAESMDRRVNAR